MRDPRVRGGSGGLLRGNIFDAGGHEQCVPARPPSLLLCMRLFVCCLPHLQGLLSRYHPDPPACAWRKRRYQRLLAAFYSNGALYILAFDVSAPAPPIDELRQWICSIQAVAPGSVVLLVGTQCD
eukprot:COSAG06_NODE_40496_length_401_cov_1.208609_1_plen_124_part_10